jgi:hypothetical protein
MHSKFHRWWLGACVAALLLASWAGGFSVAVTAVFVVIYLTGVTLVGPEDEADIGLASGYESLIEPEPAMAVATAAVGTADDDAEHYPEDDDEGDDARSAPAGPVVEADETDPAAVVVRYDAPADTAVVVESAAPADTTAVIEIVEAEDEATGAMITEKVDELIAHSQQDSLDLSSEGN